jgi:hypothetical protein
MDKRDKEICLFLVYCVIATILCALLIQLWMKG